MLAVFGIKAYLISVQVDLSLGRRLNFLTVGLPDTAVRESSERVKAALRNCGYDLPPQHITVNLAPANVKKEGSPWPSWPASGVSVSWSSWGQRPRGCGGQGCACLSRTLPRSCGRTAQREGAWIPLVVDRRQSCSYSVDFQDVRRQYQAKRALEVATAGAHNILMS